MANYLVTGAAGGMGSALCQLLTEQGHQVWGLDQHSPIESVKWDFMQADITNTDALQEAFLMIQEQAKMLDGIIHTAGIYDLNSLLEMSEEEFLHIFDVNLFGMFRINRLFAPLLAPKSRIVVVSSELAPLCPLPFTGIYAITKTAVEKYAAALRMEVQLLGHRVIIVRPGAVKTNMLPVSTNKLDRFCSETKLYQCNAARFKRIVNSVEARNVSPQIIGKVILKALTDIRPRLVYTVNRNPLLLILNALPVRLQCWIIKRILQE